VRGLRKTGRPNTDGSSSGVGPRRDAPRTPVTNTWRPRQELTSLFGAGVLSSARYSIAHGVQAAPGETLGDRVGALAGLEDEEPADDVHGSG
jgi:hypothetical protein